LIDMKLKLSLIITGIITGMLLTVSGCQNEAMPEVRANGSYEIPVDITHPGDSAVLSLTSTLPGMMRLIGCDAESFVTGTIQYSEPEFSPQIGEAGCRVYIKQKSSIKEGNEANPDYLNLWKLKVSDARPLGLWIDNALAEGHWNFSGLPIRSLKVKAGAGKNAFTIDEGNPEIMQRFDLVCGTGEVIIEGLMNAACEQMNIEMGVGELTLRFNGENRGSKMDINIKGGKGVIRIVSPDKVLSTVQCMGGGEIITAGKFRKVTEGQGKVYTTRPQGGVEEIQINIKILANSGPVYLESS
jgi:hypothetical protein